MSTAVIPIRESLYSIEDHLAALFDTYDMVETAELQEEIDVEIARYLEAEVRKVDGIAGYLSHCEKQQEFAAEEIKRLQERKSTYAKRFDRLKQYVIEVMERQGAKKLEGRTSTLMLRACPVSVLISDDEQIPEEYLVYKTTVSADKRAIKAAIEAKVDVPGAQLVSGLNTLVRK